MALRNSTGNGADDAARQTSLAIDQARGRKDGDGTPAVIKMKPLKKALQDLMQLADKADAARDKFNNAVKTIGEQSGLLAAVVKKFVKARHAGHEKFEAERGKAEQTDLVFREIPMGKKPAEDETAAEK